jgi:poly(A) polymerase
MNPVVLPDVEWRHAEGLERVVEALTDEHGGPRIVGGAVRDTLLGLPVTDVDLATMLLPNVVADRLEAARIKAVPTGLDHGTITAVADGKNYEITTLRRDVATDGRRATVVFATDWREDAARRDFTINALYADPDTGEIFDYFGGLEDLKNGTLRFIGDANQRIAEDHLRILRYFRFLARFGEGAIDPKAIVACAEAANNLLALSRERIASELLKLLALPDPLPAISLMAEHAIFASFLPELSDNAVETLDRLLVREKAAVKKLSLPARLLSLLPRDADIAQNVAMRLKLSNAMRADMVARVSGPPPVANNIRALAYLQNMECARDAAMLFANDPEFAACMKQLEGWVVPEFAIKGGDLIKRGLSMGPVVAETLRLVEARWISEGFPRERVQAIADQAVADALLASKNA